MSDTLIAFAAKAGSTAADGNSVHSPFTTALLKHIATPALDLRIAFGRVRDEVMKATNNKQEPFVYGSLGGATVALVRAPDATNNESASVPSNVSDSDARAARDYDLTAKVGTRSAWDTFLEKHPVGFTRILRVVSAPNWRRLRQRTALRLSQKPKSRFHNPKLLSRRSERRVKGDRLETSLAVWNIIDGTLRAAELGMLVPLEQKWGIGLLAYTTGVNQ